MKYRKIAKWFLCFLGTFVLLGGNVFADSSKIKNLVFTTTEQSIRVSTLSEALTIQTQNDAESAEKVDETNDVTFSSTSAMGEFLGSTGKPVTTYMSKNTASKTFYYRDATPGVYTISILIKGRDTGKTFGASQKITVGDSGSAIEEVEEDDEKGSSREGVESTTSKTGESFAGESSHSSSAPLSDIKDDFDFKADAGRKRIVAVNSPVTFNAKIAEAPKNIGAKYFWSFGDGSSKKGKDVTHAYSFPGEYNVLLTVEMGEYSAVSKTKVKVFEPKISIADVVFGKGGFVTIKNDTGLEVNLDGWMLFYGKISFTFPQDTIIDGGALLKVPFAFNKSVGEEVRLLYPNRVVVSTFSLLEKELASLVKQLAVLEEDAKIRQVPFVRKEFSSVTTSDTKEEGEKPTTTISNSNQILVDTYLADKKEDSMLAYPGRIFRKIKSMIFGE